MAYDISDQLIGDSVLHAHGEAWAAQRPKLEKSFAKNIMEGALPRVIQTANELINKWESELNKNAMFQAQVDVDMLKLTMDVIGRAAFDFDFNSVTSEAPLYDAFQTILITCNRRGQRLHEHFLRKIPFLNVEFDNAIGKLNKAVNQIVDERLKKMKEN